VIDHDFEPDQETFAIVVLGDFNPAIFHPAWFSANQLLPEEETREAEIAVITKEVAAFVVGNIHVQVDPVRFGLTTTQSTRGPVLRDVASGTLSVLEHTPLSAIGLNLDLQFHMPSEADWHRIGHALAPKELWTPFLEEPGMRHLVIEGTRPGCDAQRIHIQVQPIFSPKWSILVRINQHYRIDTADRPEVSDRHDAATRILDRDWPSFCSFAKQTAAKLLADCLQKS